MNPIIHDLDKDRIVEKIIIGGREVDISFIPVGISIPLLGKFDKYTKSLKESNVVNADGSVNENAEKELSKKPEKASENINLMIEIISMFTEYKDPEMTKEWIEQHLNINEIAKVLMWIIQSLTRDMKGESKESKKKLNGNE